MGNSQSDVQNNVHQCAYKAEKNGAVPPKTAEDFAKRWAVFIKSLDVTEENLANIESLEPNRKVELLLNFESKNARYSAFHYVTLIKGLRSSKLSLSRRLDEIKNAQQILSATDISLRTNHVEWLYDFLKHDGLDVLIDFMGQALQKLIQCEDLRMGSAVPHSDSVDIVAPSTNVASKLGSKTMAPDFGVLASQRTYRRTKSSSADPGTIHISMRLPKLHKRAVCGASDAIKKCIHLCLRCFRTLLNNQKGCELCFANRDAINIIVMSILHPHYQTKSLVLDLLAAMCLIEGGHERVISAFDYFKLATGEERRFETLLFFYRHHETLPLDDYSVDYAVSCMQFINIAVHSVENVNFRVYLQQEFSLLGLDNLLKKMKERGCERLVRQVEAYNDNCVDCAVLLEDAENKEQLTSEIDRLEKELSQLQEKCNVCDAEKIRFSKQSEERLRDIHSQLEQAQIRESELSRLVENLRTKIRDINVNSCDRESDLRKEIVGLQEQLMQKTEQCQKNAQPSPNVYANSERSTSKSMPNGYLHEGVDHPYDAAAPACLTDGEGGMEKSVISGYPTVIQTKIPMKQEDNVNYSAPIIAWNILRNKQGTLFEDMDVRNQKLSSRVVEKINFNSFDKIFGLKSLLPCDGTLNDKLDGLGILPNGINGICNESSSSEAVCQNGHASTEDDHKISLLDVDRRSCLSRVVSYFETEGLLDFKKPVTVMPYKERLARTIQKLELTSEAADRLLYQLPSAQEVALYKEIAPDNLIGLAKEDRLIAILASVHRVEMKLEAILYIETFDKTFFSLQEKMRIVDCACQNVMESAKLIEILEIVLVFGNRLNSERRGQAVGFRLHSLDLLYECRSLDSKWSLIHYIAHSVQESFPHLVDFYSELPNVSDAAKVSQCAVSSAIDELELGMNRVKDELEQTKTWDGDEAVPAKLSAFVEKQSHKIESLRVQAEKCRSLFVRTAEYFGERELHSASPDVFFGILQRFEQSFKRALVENDRRRGSSDNRKKKSKEPRKVTTSDSKKEKRRKNRTRQLNADNMMDDILAGLDSQPLQAGLHAKKSSENLPTSSSTAASKSAVKKCAA